MDTQSIHNATVLTEPCSPRTTVKGNKRHPNNQNSTILLKRGESRRLCLSFNRLGASQVSSRPHMNPLFVQQYNILVSTKPRIPVSLIFHEYCFRMELQA